MPPTYVRWRTEWRDTMTTIDDTIKRVRMAACRVTLTCAAGCSWDGRCTCGANKWNKKREKALKGTT